MTTQYGLWIGNEEILDPTALKESLDPSTNLPWTAAMQATREHVDRAVAAARAALEGPWGALTPADRSALLKRFAAVIREEGDRLAAIETTDTGKLLAGTRVEMQRTADYLEYYAGIIRAFEGTFVDVSSTRHGVVAHRPRGVVAALSPFNGPVTMTMWKLAPALAAGNTIVIKPSPETPASPGELGRLAAKAGFPAGVVNIVYGDHSVGAALVEHPGVDCVGFTGSSAVGRRIAAIAAGAMKHVLIEGGGKSAFIVFDDAALDFAVNQAANGIFGNSGQSCVAGSRMLVQRRVYQQFVERLAVKAAEIRVGKPTDPKTQMGPLTTRAQIERIQGVLSRLPTDGGEVVTGGRLADGPELQNGNYFMPTLVVGVANSAEICQTELFGPVGVILPFDDEAEVVALANGTDFGLAAGLWTENIRRANQVARQMQAGTVWINCYRAFEHVLPFGGFKYSGMGRENGMAALREYTQTQTILTDFSPVS